VPLGSSSPDIWAGPSVRTPEEERYDSALVALDIATGKLIGSPIRPSEG
jgi:quinoprotein glucose dehydrogenase